jgi:PhnB protein
MNININPYLKFNGNTEETLKFYKSVFGGDFNMVMILFTLKKVL